MTSSPACGVHTTEQCLCKTTAGHEEGPCLRKFWLKMFRVLGSLKGSLKGSVGFRV